MVNELDNQNQALAREEMYKSIRDLLSLKITVPLGNPNFKHIHTNMFIWCDLSSMIPMENFHIIAEAMHSTFNRWVSYEENRWYVEGVTINVDGNKATMDLDLNPFPSTLRSYHNELKSFQEAYRNYQNNSDGSGGTGSVTSTGSSCTGGEGEFIDNLVRNICGACNDPLERAKSIHNHIKSKQHYSSYSCSNSAYHQDPETIYKNITHINCADMATLTRAMMASAGLTCYVVHNNRGVGHFWVVIEINGQKYASDNASTATREFDYFWNPETGQTEKAVNGGKYYYNRGKKASC